MTEQEIELKKKRALHNFRTELKDLLERYNAELDIDIEEDYGEYSPFHYYVIFILMMTLTYMVQHLL